MSTGANIYGLVIAFMIFSDNILDIKTITVKGKGCAILV